VEFLFVTEQEEWPGTSVSGREPGEHWSSWE